MNEEQAPLQIGHSFFILDNISLDIQASGLPAGDFVTAEPGAASQVATLTARDPYREYSITAVPYGTKPGTESLPPATQGGSSIYEQVLRDYRLQRGGLVQDGSTAVLFGQEVRGLHSLVDLFIDGPLPKPVVIDEWVVEAGDRLWILRVSREQATGGIQPQSASTVEDLVLDSSSLANPTSLNGSQPETLEPDTTLQVNAADLPTPAWWQGDCDYNYYYSKSGGVGTYRLGGVYLGVPACGPRPYYDSAPDVLVRFYPGSWGEYEWECVELAMRYLYLGYGISPYQANGSTVVWNYAGIKLEKITNGTVNKAPRPGDVLSYGSTSTWGHTSVVSASAVNASGDGTITVIEQNASPTGISILNVNQWVVAGNAGAVSGWLHDSTVPYATFADVPFDYTVTYGGVEYQLHDYIQALYDAGFTAGCATNPLRFCPNNTLTRVESAVFMLRGVMGLSYAPPTDPAGYVFGDDWSSSLISWGRPWAEGMWDKGMTAGCSADPLLFCPTNVLTRAEAAVFGLHIEYGMSYTPPAASHIFGDDWSSPTISWAEPWAEKAYLDGLLPGCGMSGDKPLFCPGDLVTRAWAAYAIVNASNLLTGP